MGVEWENEGIERGIKRQKEERKVGVFIEYLYSGIASFILCIERSAMDHTVLPANYTMPAKKGREDLKK